MRILYYAMVSIFIFVVIVLAAFDNTFGLWTPLLNFLGEGWTSYAIVYAVSLAGVIAWDVVSVMGKKNKQEPSQGG